MSLATEKCKECIRCLDGLVACKYEAICEPLTKAELFIPVSKQEDEVASEATLDASPTTGLGLPSGTDFIRIAASSGSTAHYYEIPMGTYELQDLISYLNCNAQMGEIGRAWMRYGKCPHSSKKRDLEKIIFYAQAELKRLEKYES